MLARLDELEADLRHVGSARDEAELGLLMEKALRLLEDDQQGVLDLGITPQAR
jgi:hypothetical protein